METSPRIPPACPPRPIEPVRHKQPPVPKRNSDSTDPGNPFFEPMSDETKNGFPVRNGAPPKQGRKSVRSTPPPIPSRVDLGEKAPVKTTDPIQQRSSQDVSFKREFPKHKIKGRPEITIVSARPMDSPEVVPHPALPHASPPVPVLDAPTVPQKPSRKAKGREPPPRPKSRPVSELIFGDDVPESGPTESQGKIDKVDTGQSKQMIEGSALSGGPVGPAPKRPNRPDGGKSVKSTGHGLASNSEKTSELNDSTGGAVEQGNNLVRIPSVKSTAGRGDVRKKFDREVKSPVAGNEESDGTKQAVLENDGESKVEESVAGKKNRPTVIIARPQRKLESARERENDQGANGETDLSEEKPKPVTDKSMGCRVKPPAKKPKPTPTPKPDIRPKPTNKTCAPIEQLKNETESLSKPVGVTGPKARSVRPTVIAAKPTKTVKTPKAKDDEFVESKNGYQPQEVNTPAGAMKQEREEVKPTSPSTKPKRVPTVIKAPRPVVEDSGKDASSPDTVRKAPKRPTRGPSMKKPPPRPPSVPSNEGTTQDGQPVIEKEPQKVPDRTQDKTEQQEVNERIQDKKAKPSRPVNLPALKDGEPAKDEEKAITSPLSDEDSPALRRKKLSGKLPSPRPPPVQYTAERSGCASEAHDKLQSPDESPKVKKRPRPPRPLPSLSDEKSVTEDNNENNSHFIATSKSHPARLSPKEVRDTNTVGDAYQDKEKPQESPKHKAKPDRPPSSITKEAAVSKETGVTERVAGDHVQDKKDAREQHVDNEEQKSEATSGEEKTKDKARPKPTRPPSTAFKAKNKPQRPPAPHVKDTKETSSVTQVSSVCETYIEPSAVALYDYSPSSLDDLSFNAGDEIILVKRIDDNWYVGRLGNKEGMFPVKFVEIIEDLPQETEKQITGESSVSFNVTALYDFHGNQHDGELVFTAGELVNVLYNINEDWLMGESCGKTGSFPSSFVDVTPEQLGQLEKLPSPGTDISPSKNPKEVDTDSTRIGSDVRTLCKALFDYHSDVQGDLTFNAGDLINLNSKISDDWIEGELNGLTGIFPSSYVEIIEDLGNEAIVSYGPEEESGSNYSIAQYDFTGTSADELSFNKGDKIQITDIINEEWLKGKMNGHEGIFPRAFVKIVDENPMALKASNIADGNLKSVLKDDSLTPKAKALFDFSGETEEELSFKTGDVILLLESVNADWMKGELGNNQGRFPATFVDILVPLP